MDFENETIFSGDAMAFDNFRNPFRQGRDFGKTTGKRPNPDKRGDLVSERLRIEIEPITSNGAVLFQTTDAFLRRWIGHANLPSQLGDRHSRIFLKKAYDFKILVIMPCFFTIHK